MDPAKKVGWLALVVRLVRAILRRVFGGGKPKPPTPLPAPL